MCINQSWIYENNFYGHPLKTSSMDDNNIWVLLSLYLTNQATEEQARVVLDWIDQSYENRSTMEQAQMIIQKLPSPQFDSITAFKKLDKKIKS
jgi:hypothetical protein